MRAYVGVTDDQWYRFLADRPHLAEVNFWQPSGGRGFHSVSPGEPFFFKTHSPHNRVVGGGLFSDSAPMLVSEAWELVRRGQWRQQHRGNARPHRPLPAGTDRPRRRSGHRLPVHPGCAVLSRGGDGRAAASLCAAASSRAKATTSPRSPTSPTSGTLCSASSGLTVEVDLSQPWHRPGPVFGDPRLTPYRLGQRSFQAVVLDAYHRRCAISGTHIPPVLQAAHIRPVD